MPRHTHFLSGLASELTKVGARAGLKLIRNLVEAGEIGKANRIARTSGVLKATKAGSQVKHLGAGAEGVATLTADPKRGLSVRKIYDPKGAAGPGLIARKAELGKKLQGNPNVANLLEESKTRIGPAHHYEYVHGKPASEHGVQLARGSKPEESTSLGRPNKKKGTKTDELQRKAERTKIKIELEAKRHGMDVADLTQHNMVVTPSRQIKAIDFLPYEKRQPAGVNKDVFDKIDAANAAAKHGERHKLVDYLEDKRRPGNLAARAYRGAPPLPPPKD